MMFASGEPAWLNDSMGPIAIRVQGMNRWGQVIFDVFPVGDLANISDQYRLNQSTYPELLSHYGGP